MLRSLWSVSVSFAFLSSFSSCLFLLCLSTDTEMNHIEFQREVQMLKRLRHRHLISLFAICTASSPYYIITELMDKGSLLTLLRSMSQIVSRDTRATDLNQMNSVDGSCPVQHSCPHSEGGKLAKVTF